MAYRLQLTLPVTIALLVGCSGATPVASPTTPASPVLPSGPVATTPIPSSPGAPSPSGAPPTGAPTAVPASASTTGAPILRCPAGGPTSTPFAATAAPKTQAPVGGALGLQLAAAGVHPGYDRVVLTLAGSSGGKPGWQVHYVATTNSSGSGNPVPVSGSAFLEVAVTGVGYPQDTGVPDPAVKHITPSCTKIVRQVVLDTVFEGTYTVFLGLSGVRPFRVFRLANPARVVIDVRHV